MKLTKREKKLLQILCGMLLFFGYFYFLIEPQWNKLEGLAAEKEVHSGRIEAVENSLESKDSLEQEIKEVQKEIEELKNHYFSSIDQGRIILLMDEWIETSGLQVPALTFSEYREELLAEETVEAITLTVPFEGDYVSLLELLREIRSHEKRILVSELNIQNNFDGNIKGDLLLDFYRLKDTVAVGEKETPSILGGILSSNKLNPFNPFQGYIREVYEIAEEIEGNYNDLEETDSYIPDADYDDEEGRTPTPTETTITVMLNDFETLNTFFVGEPREIGGGLYLDTNAQSGQHALRMEYDFFRPRQRATANVVFEGEKLTMETMPEKIQLSLYAYGESNHSIAVVLKDSRGKEYIVDLTKQINWRGWKRLEAKLPKEITYPADLQRIVLVAKDNDPVTKGILLIDQLEVVYDKEYIPVKKTSPESTNTAGEKTYKVQKGDTLFSIAMKFYGDASNIKKLMEVNNIKNSSEVFVGQQLIIPSVGETTNPSDTGAVEYVVQKGDTLYSISMKFYKDASKKALIMKYNGITNENHVEVGQTLLIPKL